MSLAAPQIKGTNLHPESTYTECHRCHKLSNVPVNTRPLNFFNSNPNLFSRALYRSDIHLRHISMNQSKIVVAHKTSSFASL